MSTAILTAALAAHAHGLCVLPPREDGSKRPILTSWERFQHERPTENQIGAWYATGLTGLGFVCGAISGNLEMLEFETRAAWDAYLARADETGLGDLVRMVAAGYCETPPRGGTHLLYRCAAVLPNTKLASRPTTPEERHDPRDTRRVMIETRGEGGYVVVAPSNGTVHPTGNPYVLVSGGVHLIETITPEDRDALFDLARTFDEMPGRTVEEPRPRGRPPRTPGTRPGDAFGAATPWATILEGWVAVYERAGETYWRRPGKDRGISATTNYKGSDVLKVFTSSTAFEPDATYTKFAAYALLKHGGDFTVAARTLRAQGFGDAPDDGGSIVITPPIPPSPSAPPAARGPLDYPDTDSGNAEVFARHHAGQMCFNHQRGKWYQWDAHGWVEDDDGRARRLARDVARRRQLWALAEPDADRRKRRIRWAFDSENRGRIEAMLALAGTTEGLTDAGDGWNADPWLLGCPNGVVDLRTGVLRPGAPADRISLRTAVPHDTQAPCPRWERFLDEVFGALPGVLTFVRRAIGYSLTGVTTEQCLFLCYGTGANGKSTMLTTLRRVFGAYASTTPFTTLEHEKAPSIPNDLAALQGKRLVLASEVSEATRLNEGRVKAITGGDVVSARFLHQEHFEFVPILKLWLAVNHRPRVYDDSHGFWRRVRLIPFTRQFSKAEADPTLGETLWAEAPGILAWVVRATQEWLAHGMESPEVVARATDEYREESDPLAEFVANACEIGDGLSVRGSEFYRAYAIWAKTEGLSQREVVGTRSFGDRMTKRFLKKHTETGAVYHGVRLKDTTGYIIQQHEQPSRIHERYPN